MTKEHVITHAIQKGNFVYVYDNRTVIFMRSGELQGYTGQSVTIKRGNFLYVYNPKGITISTHTAR